MSISAIASTAIFAMSGWLPLGVVNEYLGEFATNTRVDYETDGTPLAVYEVGEVLNNGRNPTVYVKRWDGSSWTQMGSYLDSHQNRQAMSPSIGVSDSGEIYVAFSQTRFTNGGPQTIQVRRWNGTSWEALGDPIITNEDNNGQRPTMTIGGDGYPVIAYTESLKNQNITLPLVVKWDGTEWQYMGDPLEADTSNFLTRGSMTSNIRGLPVIAYRHDGLLKVKKWNGRQWIGMGHLNIDPNEDAYHPQLSTGSTGRVFASWHERNAARSGFVVHSAEWRQGAWQPLGGIINDTEVINKGWQTSLDIRGKHVPVISWMDFSGRDIYVSQYVRARDTWITVTGKKAVTLFGPSHHLSVNNGTLNLAVTDISKDIELLQK